MVGLDPVVAHLVKGVVHGVHHGVFLAIHGFLLQSGVNLVHGDRGGVGSRPLPGFQIHLQVGGPELEALEVGNGFQLLGGAHHTGTAVGRAHELEAGVIAYGVLDLLAQVAVPYIHKVIVAAEHIRHSLNVGQGGKGSQRTDGLAHHIGHTCVHALQHLCRGAQLGAAVQVYLHPAVGQLLDLLGKENACVIGIVALGGVQRHFPAVFHLVVVCGACAAR